MLGGRLRRYKELLMISEPINGIEYIASMWKRFISFVIDITIIVVIGNIFGYALFDTLSGLSWISRIIGYIIVLAYFGILNSKIGNGQTIGNRLMGIKVIKLDKTELPLSTSLIRSSLYLLPILLNNWNIPISKHIIVALLLGFILLTILLEELFYIIMNRENHQLFHDFLCNSIVINKKCSSVYSVETTKKKIALSSLIVPVIVIVIIGVITTSNKRNITRLGEMQEYLNSDPLISNTILQEGTTKTGYEKASYINVIVTKRKNADNEKIKRDIISKLLNCSIINGVDNIGIQIVYGYDIGIASSFRIENTLKSTKEWGNYK
jgi:uncharacterized RDD family membrane protein YckC